MNQQLIKTDKATILVVGLPEGAEAWKNDSYHVNTLWYKDSSMRNPKHIDLPSGNWELLDNTWELTEEQLEPIFGFISTDIKINLFEFHKLLSAFKVYKENPFDMPTKEEFKDQLFCKSGECKAYFDSLNEWQEAQSRTWSNSVTLIMKNEK